MQGLWRGLEPVAVLRLLAARWTEVAAYAAACLAAFTFIRRAVERHRSFESNAYDFGFFDQIIWNTSQGRWFETSFTPYNFLGQHFQLVLLPFALAYRLGAGIEILLVTQALFVGAAAVPLYYATRRATSSGIAALLLSLGFLFSASLHRGLDFDFHPELMSYFFVFLAVYSLVAARPLATIAALLPVLALKEDMPMILAAFAVLLFARGFRREGAALFGIAAAYAIVVVLVVMPWIRGGSGDLTERYGYLIAESTWWSIVPDVTVRAMQHLWPEPVESIGGLLASTGFVGLMNPLAVFVALPSFLLAGLSDHPQQSRLELHYATAPLALTWVAVVLGIGWMSRLRVARQSVLPPGAIGAGIVVGAAFATFLLWSPYSPRTTHFAPSAAHREIIGQALAAIPPDAVVSAQGTLLPHLSQRQHIYEFPRVGDAEYIIVDSSLPTTGQTREAGYERGIASLEGRGYDLIFDVDGVQVFRRVR
jgi:uncharacterized membrane protein